MRIVTGAFSGRLAALFGGSVARRIAANTGWLLFDRVVRMGVGLLVGAWVARYLGPGRFGLLSYALALVTMFSVMAGAGLESVVVKDMVGEPSRLGEITGTAFFVKLAGGAAGFLASCSAAWLLRASDNITPVLVSVIAAGLLFQSFDVIDYHFQARVQSRWPVLARGSAFLAVSGIKVALIITGAPLLFFAFAWLSEVVLGAVGLLVVYRVAGPRRVSPSWAAARAAAMLRQSWPLVLTGLSVMIYLRIDQVMLRIMAGPEAVGNYAAAVKISELWYFLPATLAVSSFPALVEAHGTDRSRYLRRLQKLYNVMTWTALPAAAALAFLSGTLVRLVFGGDYAAAAPVLAVHAWTSVFLLHGWVKSRWIVLENLQLFACAGAAATAVLNAGLNFVLIPRQGILGAALATLAAQAALTVLFPLFHRRDRWSVLFFLRSFRLFSAL